jgi:hypothetical protein
MDFVETLFGIAPDSGSGTLEFALLVVPLLLAAIVRVARRRHIA